MLMLLRKSSLAWFSRYYISLLNAGKIRENFRSERLDIMRFCSMRDKYFGDNALFMSPTQTFYVFEYPSISAINPKINATYIVWSISKG